MKILSTLLFAILLISSMFLMDVECSKNKNKWKLDEYGLPMRNQGGKREVMKRVDGGRGW